MIILPCLGEFGCFIGAFVPMVHNMFSLSSDARRIVFCRPGDEVLFPLATEFIHDYENPIPDRQRCGFACDSDPPLFKGDIDAFYLMLARDAVARYPGDHVVRARFRGLEYGSTLPYPYSESVGRDIIVHHRERDFVPQRNSNGRETLLLVLAALAMRPKVHVVGEWAPPQWLAASLETCPRRVDETIAVLRGCRVFIGPDSGMAHLAALVGVETILLANPHDPMHHCIMRRNPRPVHLVGSTDEAIETLSRLMAA
jgi:hypothetical protein